MADERFDQSLDQGRDQWRVPAPTAWPITLAFGITLIFAGLVTSEAVSVLGAIVAIAGIVGWFRAVLPHEAHETVRAALPGASRHHHPTRSSPCEICRGHAASLPAGGDLSDLGGNQGRRGWKRCDGAALAMLYGLVSLKGIWYPINLLAAGFMPAMATQSTAQIAEFQLSVFLIAIPIHLITSLLVGLLYGAMLPMMPRRPVLLGGVIAPLLWSGLIYSVLGIVNPVLNQRIDWLWFVFSQVGFGLTAGIIVSWQGRIRTLQRLPFALRAGMEASGMKDEKP